VNDRLLTVYIFHYSSQLQTWSQIWFSTSFSDFRQGLAGLRHVFDQLSTFFIENLVANQSRHVEIDVAGLQQIRWFVCVLDK